MSIFTAKEYLRYTRHIQLPQIGAEGQTKLKNSHALVIGCGGLGAPVSLYLAAAGIGTITLVDGDNIELTNLQRQITFTEADIGKGKADVTQQRLLALNSDISVHTINEHLHSDNAADLIKQADIVLDCTDNFSARYLINDQCKKLKKPWIYASIFQFSGQCAVFTPEGPCFRCLFPEPPEQALDCNIAGVLGVLPGLLGTIQATEAVKYLLDIGDSLTSQLLLVETQDMRMQTIALSQDSNCPCCNNSDAPVIEKNTACESAQADELSISAAQFNEYIQRGDIELVDVRTTAEHKAFNLGGKNITADQIETCSHALDKQKTILLYCQSGIRSAKACQLLNDKGFNAFSLQGGLVAAIRNEKNHARPRN